MSDIIFTPPATGGGGTTINPTNNFIPVRSNATTFIDSNITNIQDDYIATLFSNNLVNLQGLKIDFTNVNANLGDFLGIYNGTNFKVDYLNDNIITQWSSNDIGLLLDFTNDAYYFGDFNSVSSGTSFFIDVASGLIFTKHSGQQEGLFFDFVNDYFSFGDFNNTNNGIYLKIDDDNKFIATYYTGSENGFKLIFVNNEYLFGDFNSFGNGTHLKIKDIGKEITLLTNSGTITNVCDLLKFDGLLTQVGNTGDPNEFLKVTINGIPYVIKLYNP
jgi:hypothetical protein